jgi:hypothetical protein
LLLLTGVADMHSRSLLVTAIYTDGGQFYCPLVLITHRSMISSILKVVCSLFLPHLRSCPGVDAADALLWTIYHPIFCKCLLVPFLI